jgi:CRISPR-associated protein Csx14
MHKAAMPLLYADAPFDEAAPVDAKPFYFDCRSGGDAVDQGFSFDEVKSVEVLAYPAVEFLAFVGLNRFRPGGHERRVKQYATWSAPLSATLAAPVATGLLPYLSGHQYRFRLHPRDASFRYKSFGRAEPVEQLENYP